MCAHGSVVGNSIAQMGDTVQRNEALMYCAVRAACAFGPFLCCVSVKNESIWTMKMDFLCKLFTSPYTQLAVTTHIV